MIRSCWAMTPPNMCRTALLLLPCSFYWHSLSHYIGIDVHDTHLLGHDRPLEPGYAITIEPGLYIPDEAKYGPYRGIGVRIEDDILLVQDGCEVMSASVPTSVKEVEELVGALGASQTAVDSRAF